MKTTNISYSRRHRGWSDDEKQGLSGTTDLVAALDRLTEQIIGLEESGELKHGQAQSLLNKLQKAAKGLGGIGAGRLAEVTAQQLPLLDLAEVVRALTSFLRQVTRIATNLPAQIVQPIIEATLDLIDELVGLLLG